MTTTMPNRSVSVATDEPPARFRDLIATEWIKLWSLRSTAWAFAAITLAIIIFNANAAYADYSNWPQYSAETRAGFIPSWALRDAFTNFAGMSVVLAISAIGTLTITAEYSTGMIRTTFTTVPARHSVMAAKVAVLSAVTTGFGALVTGASFLVTQAILSGRGAGMSITDPGALRAMAAAALLAPVSGLVGMGLGSVIRHSATTIVTSMVLLLLLPVTLSGDHYWTAVIGHAMPYQAWGHLMEGDGATFNHYAYPSTVSGAWLVYAVWALAAAVLSVTAVHRRDQ
ncbi:ABC transporter permease [Streptomyces sp. ASQP_92]|uniref:ABC transporter permease n=1 Tax=Streptomyces sp. ASQP_92 TaxID=2979116 RepID=UPI0021C115D3|nr:ABC transporter permease [Streptomyces sp. ASQP_92]MCT9093812.1 ABC transporter permease [Streptomyces sp. ASQP_92]